MLYSNRRFWGLEARNLPVCHSLIVGHIFDKPASQSLSIHCSCWTFVVMVQLSCLKKAITQMPIIPNTNWNAGTNSAKLFLP